MVVVGQLADQRRPDRLLRGVLSLEVDGGQPIESRLGGHQGQCLAGRGELFAPLPGVTLQPEVTDQLDLVALPDELDARQDEATGAKFAPVVTALALIERIEGQAAIVAGPAARRWFGLGVELGQGGDIADLAQATETGKFAIPLPGMPVDARIEGLALEPTEEGGDIDRFPQTNETSQIRL